MSEHPPPQEAHWPDGAIFTLGHSTLPIESFVELLQTYGIERLVDIRTIPLIAERYAKGETMAALASEFGVGEATVWRALRGEAA